MVPVREETWLSDACDSVTYCLSSWGKGFSSPSLSFLTWTTGSGHFLCHCCKVCKRLDANTQYRAPGAWLGLHTSQLFSGLDVFRRVCGGLPLGAYNPGGRPRGLLVRTVGVSQLTLVLEDLVLIIRSSPGHSTSWNVQASFLQRRLDSSQPAVCLPAYNCDYYYYFF